MLSPLFDSLPGSTALRAVLALVAAFGAVLAIVPALARYARRRRFGDREGKSDSDTLNALHQGKRSTPIVGGIAMLAGAGLVSLLLADLSQPSVLVLLGVCYGLALLGLWDDVQKTFGAARTRGLTPRQKLAGQVAIGLAVGGFLLGRAGALPFVAAAPGALGADALTTVSLPFVGGGLAIGALAYLVLSVVALTGASNAVNLTDGLDGLAGGCLVVALTVYAAVAAVAGDPGAAARWGVVHVPGAAELSVPLAALVGALGAFLVYNRHPARVFMGDAGSLPLGGVLAAAALLTRQELLLVLVGGVFVAEALSVIAQVGSFKLTGRRVLRCAPLHHHFEFGGMQEAQVVSRFHAAALVCGVLGLLGLAAG